MTEIVVLLILILILTLVTLGVFWRRNDTVLAFRLDLIDKISLCNKTEINRVYEAKVGGDLIVAYSPDWRYAEFNAVPYHRMVFQFWRSLPTFYREDFPDRELK